MRGCEEERGLPFGVPFRMLVELLLGPSGALGVDTCPGVAAGDLPVRVVSTQQGEQAAGEKVTADLSCRPPGRCREFRLPSQGQQPANAVAVHHGADRVMPGRLQGLPVTGRVAWWHARQPRGAAEQAGVQVGRRAGLEPLRRLLDTADHSGRHRPPGTGELAVPG